MEKIIKLSFKVVQTKLFFYIIFITQIIFNPYHNIYLDLSWDFEIFLLVVIKK